MLVVIPACEQRHRRVDPTSYFPDIKVKVDTRAQHYLAMARRELHTPPLYGVVVSTTTPSCADQVFRSLMRRLYGEYIGADTTHAVLSFLGTEEGMKLLSIPEGEDETNLVIGYVRMNDQVFVIYVEHEFEHDEREIHIHVRPADQWTDDIPRALIILQEGE